MAVLAEDGVAVVEAAAVPFVEKTGLGLAARTWQDSKRWSVFIFHWTIVRSGKKETRWTRGKKRE